MKLAAKIGSFISTGKNKNNAYLNGCKRLAKYTSKVKYENVSFDIEYIGDNQFKFTLFTNIDLNKDRADFCKLCKDFHCSFFINEEYNCSRCNLKSFLERETRKADVSKGYYRKMIE